MVSEAEINSIQNKMRGVISKSIEQELDLDKPLNEVLNEATGQNFSKEDVEKYIIALQNESISYIVDNVEDESLVLSIFSALTEQKIHKQRIQAQNLFVRSEFSKAESYIRDLDDDKIVSLFNFLNRNVNSKFFTNSLAQTENLTNQIKFALEDKTDILMENTSENRSHLTSIFEACVKIINANINFINVLGDVATGEVNFEQKNFDGASLENSTRSLTNTKLSFLYEFFEYNLRNAQFHGKLSYSIDNDFIFTSDKLGSFKLSFETFNQYTALFVGYIHILISIPVIVQHELLVRKADIQFTQSKLSEINRFNEGNYLDLESKKIK